MIAPAWMAPQGNKLLLGIVTSEKAIEVVDNRTQRPGHYVMPGSIFLRALPVRRLIEVFQVTATILGEQ